MNFTSEAEMSRCFMAAIEPLFVAHGIECVPELNGGVGIPDFTLVKTSKSAISYVIALELKLRDWQRAFRQAYRYRNFTNEAYIILDTNHVSPALAQRERFSKAGIGLASFDTGGQLQIYLASKARIPYSRHLSERIATEYLYRKPSDFESLARRFTKTAAGRRNFKRLRLTLFNDLNL